MTLSIFNRLLSNKPGNYLSALGFYNQSKIIWTISLQFTTNPPGKTFEWPIDKAWYFVTMSFWIGSSLILLFYLSFFYVQSFTPSCPWFNNSAWLLVMPPLLMLLSSAPTSIVRIILLCGISDICLFSAAFLIRNLRQQEDIGGQAQNMFIAAAVNKLFLDIEWP